MTEVTPTVPEIKRLAPEVVNRIAAGEVIHRPCSALKELIENSLDAGSTSISIELDAGGLKLLQITDNGCGIRKEDFPILCERFTTSKLASFEDLSNISTFGFRGEALASLTHVAHVSIVSMTTESTCAYEALFTDSKLVPRVGEIDAEIKACAGVKGTRISARDLFYNVPVRKAALKVPSTEYALCLEVVTQYALRFPQCGFSCKKHGASTADVRTVAKSSTLDNIRMLYGNNVAKELLKAEVKDDSGCGDGTYVEIEAYVSNANYASKKLTLSLFINNRLVQSNSIKKALDAIYSPFLPKHTHPWVYMNIQLPPRTVDVNVHPTKKEVQFLNEDKVISTIHKLIDNALGGANASRVFHTQSLMPSIFTSSASCASPSSSSSSSSLSSSSSSSSSSQNEYLGGTSNRREGSSNDLNTGSSKQQIAPSKMVRTDAFNPQGRLDTFFRKVGAVGGRDGKDSSTSYARTRASETTESGANSGQNVQVATSKEPALGFKRRTSNSLEGSTEAPKRRKRVILLTSVTNLIQTVKGTMHNGLSDLLSNHVFVGVADETYTLIQHKTKLFLVNHTQLTRALFYQLSLFHFSNFSRIAFATPLHVMPLLEMALESKDSGWTPADGDKKSIVAFALKTLSSKANMLQEYFCIAMRPDEGSKARNSTLTMTSSTESTLSLYALPSFLPAYVPPLVDLPLFMLRLAMEVDWDDEQACFDCICSVVADFYAVRNHLFLSNPPSSAGILTTVAGENDSAALGDNSISFEMETSLKGTIFPSFLKKDKKDSEVKRENFQQFSFCPPSAMSKDGTFTQIADLQELYKVFERC